MQCVQYSEECTVCSTAPVVSSEHHQAQLQSVSARQGDIIHRATNTNTTSHLTPHTLHLTQSAKLLSLTLTSSPVG